MGDYFRVDIVHGVKDITTGHGPMKAWSIRATAKSNGMAEDAEILTKPNNAYKAGDKFYAEREVGQYGVKLKRKADPNAAPGASGGQAGSSTSQPSQARGRMSYHDALRLYDRIAEDLKLHDPGHVTTIFLSVLRGDIEPPSEAQGQQPSAGDDGSW